MNLSLHIKPEALHHAYLIVGEKDPTRDAILKFIKDEISFATRANPDFWFEEHSSVPIELARAISDFHIQKPFQGDRKIFVLIAGTVTVEAQNALLKLFEEPIAGNHFFLVMNDDRTIIPTLRSRMQSVILERAGDSDLGKEFLKSPISERLGMIEDIVENKDKEKSKKLVKSITEALYVSLGNEKDLKDWSQVFKNLLKADDYLSDRAPSVKMLLENLVYTIPTKKL